MKGGRATRRLLNPRGLAHIVATLHRAARAGLSLLETTS
jgi:hypothetical protein